MEVYISLTTLPSRITQIRKVLDSLLAQTVPVTIRIAVPKASARAGEADAYTVPAWLLDEPNVVLDRGDVDYGPATKLIPAVQHGLASTPHGDAIIIVVDDDTLYPPRLVETLLAWHQRLPHSAVSFTGWPVTDDLRYPHWTENYLVFGNELISPHPVDIVRGNCGYLVRAKFFTPALWEDLEGAPDGARYMDDVWISGHLAKNGVPRLVVPADEDQFTLAGQPSVTTLDSIQGAYSTREKANQVALQYFRGHWDVAWKGSPPYNVHPRKV
jgi:hypothetical protein